MNPPDVKFDPVSGRIAIKTTLASPRTWFVFDPQGGGHYATGTRSPDDVTSWSPYIPPTINEENSP